MNIKVKNYTINIVPLIITVLLELVLIIGYINMFGAILAKNTHSGTGVDVFITNLLIKAEALGFSGLSVLALLALILGLFLYDFSSGFLEREK